MKVLYIAGARPNFMKVAPIMEKMAKYSGVRQILIHTGQHYDDELSRIFFRDLAMKAPDIYLGVGSASHAVQTARVMTEIEPILIQEKPDWVVVVGDVNSTLAASLAASKLGLRIAHVEAGLRSFDRTMPEEINRIVTDAISDVLFTSESSGNDNLLREGVDADKIAFVGNVMIDSLIKFREMALHSDIQKRLKVSAGSYGLLTLHRPSSVDDGERFRDLLGALSMVSRSIPLVFPCHPRTRTRIQTMGLDSFFGRPDGCRITLAEPLGYLDFVGLMAKAKFVLTDSGGVQEESTVLGIPCLTVRENTERPVTISQGTNTLVGYCKERILSETCEILAGRGKTGRVPELWDGMAADRIVASLLAAK